MTGERVRVYLARRLGEEPGGAHPDGEEDLQRRWVPLEEAVAWVRDGTITNGLAVAGLLAATTRGGD